MVPQRPFLIGKPGWLRSSAWIWLFSSTQSTIACCGGFRYRPTTSVNFSRNLASRDSLKVFVRCGFRLWLFQMLFMVDLLTSCASAIVRQLQCVIPLGLLRRVASTMDSILSGPYVALRPRPEATNRSEEHTSELQSLRHLVCRLLL